MSDLTHPATSPAFEQVRSLVASLQPLGYLQDYQNDLLIHDADMLDRLAVPGARFLYSVRESGTDLMPLGVHAMIDMASDSVIDDAIRSEDFASRTRAQEARLYEFAMTDPVNGNLHYVNPDFLVERNGFNSIMRERLLESEVGASFPIHFHGQDWELTRIRPPNPVSQHLLTHDPFKPIEHRMFEINIDEHYHACITPITGKDAHYKLNLPPDWEVRQVKLDTPDRVYGDDLVALHKGVEVAHFTITPGPDGMVIEGVLTDETRAEPHQVPALVEMMIAEANLQSHSNFLAVNVADMRIDQQPIDEVLHTALRVIHEDRAFQVRLLDEMNQSLADDPLAHVAPTQQTAHMGQ
jgi:hypothetical protein